MQLLQMTYANTFVHTIVGDCVDHLVNVIIFDDTLISSQKNICITGVVTRASDIFLSSLIGRNECLSVDIFLLRKKMALR